jgi:TrmH family RNA methyltransferase
MDYMKQPMTITSRQNPRVKEAARLRGGRERVRRGQFLIDGLREIERAIAAGVRCVEAFVREDASESSAVESLLTSLQKAGGEMFLVTRDVYAKLAFGERDDGVVVVAATPQRTLSDLRLSGHPLVAVLDGVEKPGNVGAILRSADAAGLDAVVVADGRTDLYNPNTIRASLGTVFRANVCEASAVETRAWLRQQNIPVIAARPDATKSYTDAEFSRGAAIVLGSEAEGLSDEWRGEEITAVRLPMHGMADSLNVSTTAAVLFYEALRQRQSQAANSAE